MRNVGRSSVTPNAVIDLSPFGNISPLDYEMQNQDLVSDERQIEILADDAR